MKKKTKDIVFTKRKMECLQYDLATLVRNEAIREWPQKVAALYEKHFGKRANKAEEEEEIMAQEEGAGGYNIKEELIRQNNWMNSKLKSIQEKNSKLEKEKKDLYHRIQKENTELISECNMLRTSNQAISKKVLVLEKKLKDISGISLSNANLVENQLEGFLKKAAPLSSKNKKATPFEALKKNNTQNLGNRRNQMLVDYYN